MLSMAMGLPRWLNESAAIELQSIVLESVGLKLALAVDLVHVRFSYFLSTAIKERSRRGVYRLQSWHRAIEAAR